MAEKIDPRNCDSSDFIFLSNPSTLCMIQNPPRSIFSCTMHTVGCLSHETLLLLMMLMLPLIVLEAKEAARWSFFNGKMACFPMGEKLICIGLMLIFATPFMVRECVSPWVYMMRGLCFSKSLHGLTDFIEVRFWRVGLTHVSRLEGEDLFLVDVRQALV